MDSATFLRTLRNFLRVASLQLGHLDSCLPFGDLFVLQFEATGYRE